jgi:hypothetical protein
MYQKFLWQIYTKHSQAYKQPDYIHHDAILKHDQLLVLFIYVEQAYIT